MANEKRLIDANALCKDIEKRLCDPCKAEGRDYHEVACRACWVDDMRIEIEDATTVDAVEVVHGRWIEDTATDMIACTECGHAWNIIDNCTETFNYCPNCGAKMDGDGNG